MISSWKIRSLIKLGEDFKCKFCLPPFDGDITEAFFDIHEFKETESFKDFMIRLQTLDIPFEYAKAKGKMFLVIKTKQENYDNRK